MVRNDTPEGPGRTPSQPGCNRGASVLGIRFCHTPERQFQPRPGPLLGLLVLSLALFQYCTGRAQRLDELEWGIHELLALLVTPIGLPLSAAGAVVSPVGLPSQRLGAV